LILVLRAIIFDFDGIIVDSEPLIMRLTQRMAALEGWTVSDEEYYRDYLALDDRGIIERLYQSHGRPIDLPRRDELMEWKLRLYAEAIREGLPPVAGAIEFVNRVDFPLAIASGSLRSEVEHLLQKLGLREKFAVIVTADDCARSKPHPEIFLKALAELQQLPAFNTLGVGVRDSGFGALVASQPSQSLGGGASSGRGEPRSRPAKPEPPPALNAGKSGEKRKRQKGPGPLQAAECLVIEDAPAGVYAAHAAGMRCLALAHSRSAEALQHADWVCGQFADVDFNKIRTVFDEQKGVKVEG
jgi:beta-phosphoglucomutase-like phosphatase (HAD superfamily)